MPEDAVLPDGGFKRNLIVKALDQERDKQTRNKNGTKLGLLPCFCE